jgi:hypothetical protein
MINSQPCIRADDHVSITRVPDMVCCQWPFHALIKCPEPSSLCIPARHMLFGFSSFVGSSPCVVNVDTSASMYTSSLSKECSLGRLM